ncbi:MAG TPA: peptide chain release factor H, partial [Clostridia bacterium]
MWIQISSGKGPDECELAVSLFMKSYRDELSKIGIKTNVIDLEAGNMPNNFKSVLLSLECHEQDEPNDIVNGTILWICKSPYRPNHKRKNW